MRYSLLLGVSASAIYGVITPVQGGHGCYPPAAIGRFQARIQGGPLGAEAPSLSKNAPQRRKEAFFSTCSRSALYGNEHFF